MVVPARDGGPEPDRVLLSGPAGGRNDVSPLSIEKIEGPVALYPPEGRPAGLTLEESCAGEELGDHFPIGALYLFVLAGISHQIDLPAADARLHDVVGVERRPGKFRHVDHPADSLHRSRLRVFFRLRRPAAGGQAQRQEQPQRPPFDLHIHFSLLFVIKPSIWGECILFSSDLYLYPIISA